VNGQNAEYESIVAKVFRECQQEDAPAEAHAAVAARPWDFIDKDSGTATGKCPRNGVYCEDEGICVHKLLPRDVFPQAVCHMEKECNELPISQRESRQDLPMQPCHRMQPCRPVPTSQHASVVCPATARGHVDSTQHALCGAASGGKNEPAETGILRRLPTMSSEAAVSRPLERLVVQSIARRRGHE